MVVEGALPMLDGAVFADTGWEPRAVYSHLERLGELLDAAGVPLYRVGNGNLRSDAIDPLRRYASIPYFVRNPDGSEGMGRRQCTGEYKLKPIGRAVRRLLGATPPDFRRVSKGRVAEQWIGFSTDEIHRVNDGDRVSYINKRYPLLDLGMSRKDCDKWLRSRGWSSVVKSACIGCPYHGNRQWRALRDTCECGHHRESHRRDAWSCQIYIDGTLCVCQHFANPEWWDAVDFDKAVRKGGAHGLPLNGEAFLHRARVPLSIAPIDRVTRAEWADRQGDLFDELEDGDPDGCSPYGCRSGSAVAT
jgi:hypothetical protein